MAKANGISPSQLFFNWLPKQALPMLVDLTPRTILNKERGQVHATSIASTEMLTPKIMRFSLGNYSAHTAK